MHYQEEEEIVLRTEFQEAPLKKSVTDVKYQNLINATGIIIEMEQ